MGQKSLRVENSALTQKNHTLRPGCPRFLAGGSLRNASPSCRRYSASSGDIRLLTMIEKHSEEFWPMN